MTRRPAVLSLDDVIMLDDALAAKRVPEPEPAPPQEPAPTAIELPPSPPDPPETGHVALPVTDEAPSKGGRKPVPDVFRTSLYFHRTVHDALREIAYDERLTISDLINEGIDQVLKGRGYPVAAELKTKGTHKRKR